MRVSETSVEAKHKGEHVGVWIVLVLVAQQVAAKALRDALFLSHFEATALAPMIIASSLLSLVIVIALTHALVRFGPSRVTPALILTHGIIFGAECWALTQSERVAAVLVYLHSAGAGASIVSAFWSQINERYDPHSARAAVAKLGRGAALGGILGGFAVWQLANIASPENILLGLACANLIAAFGSYRLSSSSRFAKAHNKDAAKEKDTKAGGTVSDEGLLARLRAVPSLRLMTTLVFVLVVAETFADYVFKAKAQGIFESEGDLATFFGIFYTAVGAATWILQRVFVHHCLDRFGVVRTAMALPLFLLLTGALVLATPFLWPLALLRGGTAAGQNSLFKSSYELLYVPLSNRDKRKAKSFIDVGINKLAGACAALVILLVGTWLPSYELTLLLLFVLLAAISALLLQAPLHRGFIRSLEASIRSGVVDIKGKKLGNFRHVDRAVWRTLTKSTSLGRTQLLAEIEKHMEGEDRSQQLQSENEGGAADTVPSNAKERNARSLARLDSAQVSPEAIAQAIAMLHDKSLEKEEAAHVLQQAALVLQQAARGHSGQIIDALLAPTTPLAVRKRLPSTMQEEPTPLVAFGLQEGLTDPAFPVRARCAAVLLRLKRKDHRLPIDQEKVLSALRSALSHEQHLEETSSFGQELAERLLEESSSPTTQSEVYERLGMSLTYIFVLLALIGERESMELAIRAVTSEDPRLRGTALEYFDTILPRELKLMLAPYLESTGRSSGTIPPTKEIEEDLLASRVNISRAQLTKK